MVYNAYRYTHMCIWYSLNPVLLSPSGLSATLTGHSYSLSDDNVREMMEEWKLFYPKKHPSDHNYDMPAAVEVVIGV